MTCLLFGHKYPEETKAVGSDCGSNASLLAVEPGRSGMHQTMAAHETIHLLLTVRAPVQPQGSAIEEKGTIT